MSGCKNGGKRRSADDIPMVPLSNVDVDADDEGSETSAGHRRRFEMTSFFNPSYEHTFTEKFRRTSLGCFNKVRIWVATTVSWLAVDTVGS